VNLCGIATLLCLYCWTLAPSEKKVVDHGVDYTCEHFAARDGLADTYATFAEKCAPMRAIETAAINPQRVPGA
jgi:hypothetical protein